jgi:L,D-transpeptidase ErfK/SrfK
MAAERGCSGRPRRVRGLVMGGMVTLLLAQVGAATARWDEEAFVRKAPVRYRLPAEAADAPAVIGTLRTYAIQEGDTLLDVGRYFSLGYNEITAANPGVDPWLPPTGEVVVLPTEHVLPATRSGLVVNIPEMRLYYFHGDDAGGRLVTTYPVGLGRDDWRTPQGSFKIRGKTESPTWVIPESIRAERIRDRGDARSSIAGGHPDNPLGPYRLELTLPMYALHGSNMPWGVGMQVSHGCIRLYNEDMADLFRMVRVGTAGEFLYQPVKVGTRGGLIYVEVHSDIYRLRPSLEADAERMLQQYGWSDRIDRRRLRRALAEQSGFPVVISRDASPDLASR